MKLFVASWNRASNGAISKLVDRLKKENMFVDNYQDATHILAVGDRKETFDFVLERFREHYSIIHLWAGESSDWNTHDEIYRTTMMLMSDIQLCTNKKAKDRVLKICYTLNKRVNAFVVGNVMLDNLIVDETNIPQYSYILILYNPVMKPDDVLADIRTIQKFISNKELKHIWIEPNGDMYSDMILPHCTHANLPCQEFLGLLKHCEYFLTNSSCQYYEAPFLINKEKIISIGNRNKNRESKNSNMNIKNAVDNIIKILKVIR